jgi:hypothetical protein
MLQILDELMRRWTRYDGLAVSRQIAGHDAMFAGDTIQSYLDIGRSAIEVIALAMIAARKSDIRSVLDLPCGAGRGDSASARILPRRRSIRVRYR